MKVIYIHEADLLISLRDTCKQHIDSEVYSHYADKNN